MTATTTLQRWGNSSAVRLPKAFLQECRCVPGMVFTAKKVGKKIVLTPAKLKKISQNTTNNDTMTKEQLLAGITPQNRHKLLDWGRPVGKEIW